MEEQSKDTDINSVPRKMLRGMIKNWKDMLSRSERRWRGKKLPDVIKKERQGIRKRIKHLKKRLEG